MNLNHKVSFGSVIVFLIVSLTIKAQNTTIDSLKSIIETGAKDTVMVSTLNALSLEVLKENILESMAYSQKAYELAAQLDFKKGKAYSLKNIGLAAYYQGDYLKVLDYWTQSLETFEAIQDTLGIAKLVNNLGAVYYSQGSHPKALDYYLRSLKLSVKTQDPFNIVQALLNLGGLYTEMLDYDKALSFFNKIEDYRASLKDSDQITSYLMGVGEVYYEQGMYDNALKFYEEALTSTENITLRADNLIKLGLVQFKKNNREKSINYLNEAYQTAMDNNQQLLVVQALIASGNVNQQINLSNALKAFKEAENIAKEIEANDELRDIYEGLSQIYASKGDYNNAFKYQSQFIAQKDSLFNLATNDKIRGLQFDFDLQKKEDQIGLLEKESEILELNEKRQKIVKYISFGLAGFILIIAIGLLNRYKYVRKTNRVIEEEKNRSETLLRNILPEETALELKQNGKVVAKKFDSVTVLFTDFEGFTRYADNLSPEKLVETIDFYFSKFDEIVAKYNLEKIKTIGDAYMCAGGLPFPTEDHAHKMIMAAFEIVEFVKQTKNNEKATEKIFDIRIGINTGPVVSGVVGSTKFAYDIWGDAVNVASRMESMSELGKINISESTYNLVKNDFECEYRGEIKAKNRGKLKMYFVNSLKKDSISTPVGERIIEV
ncbi:MAG: tetratricopeptide repeat protein [Flavobacteriaceae bacterium]|nr:tetratricopeptide repeat protein [Flavobacteriaceae bacterium]